ncbi:MAG: Inner rane component of cytoplasmic domain [Pseudomonadota bacterium]
MNDAASPSATTEASEARRVLRVLSGLNAGAQCELREDRVLVGNIEGECDVVLDVTRPERHACLVRASSDGWTVLAIAGDLWVEREYVPPQHTCPIAPGLVITIGRVSFGVGHPDLVDWNSLAPPANLERPTAEGTLPQAALPAAPPPVTQRWRAVRLAAGLGLGALVLSAAATYVSQAMTYSTPSAGEVEAALQADKAQVAALPWAREVKVNAHPEKPGRVLVEGYVPNQEQLADLAHRLRALGENPRAELRLVAVDTLSVDLLRRFELKESAQKLRYTEQGHFTLAAAQEEMPQRDRQARTVLQELPAVQSMSVQVEQALDPEGKPLVVRYSRSADRPGDLEVSNLDAALGLRRYVVTEMRLGPLPSIVLDQGGRFFPGARLPDGSILRAVHPDRLVVSPMQGGEQIVALPDAPALREPAPSRARTQLAQGR